VFFCDAFPWGVGIVEKRFDLLTDLWQAIYETSAIALVTMNVLVVSRAQSVGPTMNPWTNRPPSCF